MSSEKEPDWGQSNNWDEFEWEQAFRFSEKITSRYFRMLRRFGDLPDAERFIAKQLGERGLFFADEGEHVGEPNPVYGSFELDDGNKFDSMFEGGHPDEIGPGDPRYYECCPVFLKARQMAIGWSNVLSSVLAQEDRFWGMRVLFYMGRILSYISLSIGDGTFDRIEGSIAFAKRVLEQINTVMGELDERLKKAPHYHSMFKIVRDLLLETRDMVVTYLFDLRDRKEKGPFGDHD